LSISSTPTVVRCQTKVHNVQLLTVS